MSYNPNGPRNTMGTNVGTGGTTGTSGTSGFGTTSTGGTTGTGGFTTSRTDYEVTTSTTEQPAEGLRQKAEHLASNVKDKASAIGAQVSDKANAAVSSMGEKMSDLGNVLRENAPEAVAPYADRAAQTLERAGNYLAHGDFGDYFDDLSGLIRRHPVPAMLTGVAIGFLLARNSRR